MEMRKPGWALLTACALSGAAHADIVLGSYDFNSAQFGNTLAQSDGGAWAAGNWLNTVYADPGSPGYLTGANFDTGIANIGDSASPPSYTIGYANAIANGAGSDLGIVTARYSIRDSITLEVSTDGGLTFLMAQVFGADAAVDSGADCNYYFALDPNRLLACDLFVTEIDLSAFGLGDGSAINAIRITGGPELDLIRVAGFADASATVPLPGSLALAGLGLLLAGVMRRR